MALSGVLIVSRSGLTPGWIRPLDPGVRLLGLPALEGLAQDRQDLGGLEVADDHELAMIGAEVVAIQRADLIERELACVRSSCSSTVGT